MVIWGNEGRASGSGHSYPHDSDSSLFQSPESVIYHMNRMIAGA
jgi:hypothetical protein